MIFHNNKCSCLRLFALDLFRLTQRAILHHQSHYFVQCIGSSHCGQLGVCIVCWRYFDNVRSHKVDAFQPTDDGAELARRPASGLWSACSRSESWVEGVDIYTQVDWVLVAYSIC